MAIYTIKRGDTWPPYSVTLKDENGPVPLYGATVTFIMKQVKGPVVVTAPVPESAINIETSEVAYPWTEDDTAAPGIYRAEWEVIFGNGKKETFPSEGWEEVRIYDDLGEGT